LEVESTLGLTESAEPSPVAVHNGLTVPRWLRRSVDWANNAHNDGVRTPRDDKTTIRKVGPHAEDRKPLGSPPRAHAVRPSSMSSWSIEPSPRGDGAWFVAEDVSNIHAFAPPGVWLPWPASAPYGQRMRGGWRCASWPAEPSPVLDAELPVAIETVTTTDVCARMPSAMREAVREVMVDQLHAALCLGRGYDGLVDDDAAQAGAAAANWVLKELRAAFPAEEWRLPASVVQLAEIPATSDALLSAIPGPRESAVRPEAHDLGGWLRKLAVALLRWLAEAITRLADRLTREARVAGDDDRPDAGAREEALVGDC